MKKRILFIDAGSNGLLAADLFNRIAGTFRLGFEAVLRTPDTVTDVEAAAAERLIGFDPTEIDTRFPDLLVDVWPAGDVEPRVNQLIAVVTGGGATYVPPPPPSPNKPAKPKSLGTVKVSRETAGRRGKGVTVVSELNLDADALKELATRLKSRCGSGGTAKDGRIEIQGDHRDTVAEELAALGYQVKRSGG
jgi:predicted translation initiation factor SUI1